MTTTKSRAPVTLKPAKPDRLLPGDPAVSTASDEVEQERLPVLRPGGRGAGVPSVTGRGKQPKDSDLRTRIGRRFRAARLTYTDTAMAMADVLDVSFQRISKIEKGLIFPDEHLVVKFCYYTGITAEWLYLGVTSAPRLSKRQMTLIEMSAPGLNSAPDELTLMAESISSLEAKKAALQLRAAELALASSSRRRQSKKAV